MDVAAPKDPYRQVIYWLGIFLIILTLISSFVLSYKAKQNELRQLSQEVKATTDTIVSPIQNTLEGYIQTLSRMTKRWEAQKGLGKNFWFQDANNYFQDAQVFQAIEWVSPDLHIRYAVPPQENVTLQGYDLSKLTTRTETMEKARTLKQPVISQVINLLQGPKGILITVPLFIDNNFNGYIIGTLNIKKLLQIMFLKNFEENYGIAIYQDDVPMFSTTTPVIIPALTQEKKVRIRNVEWKFYVWPNQNLLNNRLTYLPSLLLYGGIALSSLLLTILYFYLRLRDNAYKMIKASIDSERGASRTRKIMETINEGFITINHDRNIVYLNPYAEEMLGWKADEVIGKEVLELMIPERYRERNRESFKEFIETGSSPMFNHEIEFFAITKDGREFPVEAMIIPIKINQHYEFHVLVRDITARKKAEADQARLVSIIDSTNDAIVSGDIDGNITTWNSGAEMLYGYSAEEIIGKQISTLFPENVLRDYQSVKERVMRGEHFQSFDTTRITKDGRIIPVSVHISPIRNKYGEVVGGSSIARDISQAKKIETMKNEFISIVSHELRTPLTSIIGAISILGTEKLCALSSEARQLIEIATNNCERLMRLINDILDIEKIEAGKMKFNFQVINLNKLIEDTVKANRLLAAKKNIDFDFSSDTPFHVWGDKDRLIQVLTNLLSNAIRYSPVNDVIKIRLTRLVEMVRVSIIDNGPGIPDSFRDKIFEKFTQADTSDARPISGTGLGLNISKSIVERHGGKIGFISTEGKGSTFYFDIPIVEA